MHKRLLAVALVAVLMAPTGTAQVQNPNQPTDTTLFFHIFDTLNKFVINTQPMNDDYFEVGGNNFPTIAGTPVNQAYGVDWDLNTIYGTSTAGPVEYQFSENGKPRFHPERGIAQDVIISAGATPTALLFVEARDIFGLDALPNFLPQFTFRVTMREGDDPGKDVDYDQGNLIMNGEVTYHICGPGQMPGFCDNVPELDYPVLKPNEQGVVTVEVPLTVSQNKIPKSEAFNVRLDWYQLNGVGIVGEDQIAEGYLRFHASEHFQPRIEMQIDNPVYVEFLHPQVAAGTLLIHTGVNSPWGTYDVDANNMTVSVNGPSTPETLKRVVAKNQHVHGLHDKAAEVTYLWKFRDEGAAQGDYTIDIAVDNVRGNAQASATAGFTIEGSRAFGVDTEGNEVEPSATESGKDTPGIGLGIGLLALVGLALRRRS